MSVIESVISHHTVSLTEEICYFCVDCPGYPFPKTVKKRQKLSILRPTDAVSLTEENLVEICLQQPGTG